MGTYIVLANFTEQGIRKLRETNERVQVFRKQAEEHGVSVKEVYWTRGAYDLVTLLEAPDEEKVTALAMGVDARGNVRTTTLRAFSMDVMEDILATIPAPRAVPIAPQCCGGDPIPVPEREI
jgi:uncharacterized protein with GYD domain